MGNDETGTCDHCDFEFDLGDASDHCGECGNCWKHCPDLEGHVKAWVDGLNIEDEDDYAYNLAVMQELAYMSKHD